MIPTQPGSADAGREPVAYRTWGTDIDPAAHAQMRQSCSLPMVVGGALMPDVHVGYGLPIGGVLALDNAVVPYAVGVDFACRMKLSVLDAPPTMIEGHRHGLEHAIEKGTRFGIGSVHETPQDHPVMDDDLSVTRITREHKDRAHRQLGTSGSGNHFVEFGVLTLANRDEAINLDAGQYLALLSHSGSRGVENHHNFAWKEVHQGREVVVHRKGATPAGAGVLGVIPGSMATPAFVVRGKGHAESFDSAAHGAGRRMSRTAARAQYRFRAVQRDLEAKGVHVLSAGADEVPSVYKDILEVMAAQKDLVDPIARFDPRIVKMSGDGKAED